MTFYITDNELTQSARADAQDKAATAKIAYKAAMGRRDGSLERYSRAYINATAELIRVEIANG